jgi:hypothetical protein
VGQAAAYADLTGLPAVRINVGEDVVLLDDSIRYGERLEAAGRTVQVHVREGMTHVFPSYLILHAAQQALDDSARSLGLVPNKLLDLGDSNPTVRFRSAATMFEMGSTNTQERASVKRANVTAKIQRHPWHNRVFACQLEFPRVRGREESQRCFYRFAGVYGYISGDEGRILR